MVTKAKLVDATVSLMLALAAMSPATEGAEATLVKDINPFGPSDPTNLRNADGRLFFTADDGVSGPELWRSEGTDASTVKVRDIQPGPAGAYPRPVTGLAGGLLFSANDGVNGFELWKSDGTGTGTALVKDLNPGPAGSDPGELTETNGSVDNIAGVANERGNVMGLMPHPERASEAILGSEDGRKVFEGLVRAVAETRRQ